jgi:hypothetical protein
MTDFFISNAPGPIFVLGMRRSGTSLLRRLVEQGTGGKILFEPHDIWFAIRRGHLERIRKTRAFQEAVRHCRQAWRGHEVFGAKFAFDPGIEAMEWRWLQKRFKKPKFICIYRNLVNTYNSYIKEDAEALRGVARMQEHTETSLRLQEDWHAGSIKQPEKFSYITYEDLAEDPEFILRECVFDFLNVTPENLDALVKQVRRPDGTER